MEARPPPDDGASYANLPGSVIPSLSSEINHRHARASPECGQFCSHGELLAGECDVSPFSSPLPRDHDCDAAPANHSVWRPVSSHPARLDSFETVFSPVPADSLLFSLGDTPLSPIPRSPPPITSLSHEDLCSINFSPRFPPGHHLDPMFAQRYLLGDELGFGGYGFVMTALHRRLESEVAVKFVIKEKVPEQAWINHDMLGRIPMEIMLLRNMNHENIVKCIDIFEDELFFYVVQELHGTPWRKKEKSRPPHEHSSPQMSTPYLLASTPLLSPAASDISVAESEPETPPQLCDQLSPMNLRLLHLPSPDDISYNTSAPQKKPDISLEVPKPHYSRRPSHDLFECIEQTKYKRLSERQARYIMAQVVEAVFYLDSQGISHRDIKDENLVIDKYFRVKLIDFGSATMVDPTQPRPFYNLFFGTTAYAASEVLLKQPYQAAPVEIWTLGVLMSYLLTGMSPFPTERDAIEGRIVLAELPGGKLSELCLHLITRCLEPEPSLRADIEEVRTHPWLTSALEGL